MVLKCVQTENLDYLKRYLMSKQIAEFNEFATQLKEFETK